MQSFTAEEFEQMIAELTNPSGASFQTLCLIADKTLRQTVQHWCANDPVLSGKDMVNDIMQEIFCRLIKTCVTHFLLRNDCNGQINRDPVGFQKWMFTVARNIKKDVSNHSRRDDYNTTSLGKCTDVSTLDSVAALDERKQHIMVLKEAFSIVLNSDVRVYKVLTWLAQCLYIIQFDYSKIESNDKLIEDFSEKTLFEMRDILFEWAKKTEWMHISSEQKNKIDQMLNMPFQKETHIGDIKYKDFFMKKGGKASISDWVNRMNNLIESRIKHGAFDN